MKKIILLLACSLIGYIGYSQCGKRNLVTSNKMEQLEANGEVGRVREETLTIEFDGKEIIATPPDDQVARGQVTSITCEWKTPYKEGKTVIKAHLVDPNNNEFDVEITIEGKEGKLTMMIDLQSAGRKFKCYVEKFEEKKI